MGRKAKTGWAVILILAICAIFGGLGVLPAVLAASNPIDSVVATSISPLLLLGGFGTVLFFLLAVVILALRAGRSVRIGRRGVTIGGRRR